MCSCGNKSMWKVVYADGSQSAPMSRSAALAERAKHSGAKVIKAT